jgi:predicted dehydrogenase
MRFALLGDHPDGLDFARALGETGRHTLAVYSGPPVGAEYLRRWGLEPRRVGDVEEVLADPIIDAVIVAGRPWERPAQLRRALQSERHVVCVHPADHTPDTAYEAAMIQGDTRQLLLPLLPEAMHPAFARLAEWIRRADNADLGRKADGEPGATAITAAAPAPGATASRGLHLLEMERWSPESVLLDGDTPGDRPALPGWDVLRTLGGEIVEVLGFAAPEEVAPDEPLLLAGRFERGGLFQVSLLPNRPEPRWRLTAYTRYERAELVFPQGWPGPARLTWRDVGGEAREETWETWNPWPVLVEAFETALAARVEAGARVAALVPAAASQHVTATAPPRAAPPPAPRGLLTWQDAVRSLELDDAARRSVERRRASTLEYQEATEEAGFKGTMTLVGCGLLWGSLVLLILSRWLPWLGWVIAPVFGVFLLLQLLRWIVPARPGGEGKERGRASEPEA